MEKIGLIGFGEVGSFFCRELSKNGFQPVVYCSGSTNFPPYQKNFIEEVNGHGGILLETPEDLCNHAEFIFSVVTPQTAINAANAFKNCLTYRHLFIDFNSCNAFTKKKINELISSVSMIDAVLFSSPLNNDPLHILLSGSEAKKIEAWLNQYDCFNAETIGDKVGAASEMKMMRSSVNKSINMLIYDLLLIADKLGQFENLWRLVIQDFDKRSFEFRIRKALVTTIIHHERRYHELTEAKNYLLNYGENSEYVNNTVEWFDRFCKSNLDDIEIPNDIENYDPNTLISTVRKALKNSDCLKGKI